MCHDFLRMCRGSDITFVKYRTVAFQIWQFFELYTRKNLLSSEWRHYRQKQKIYVFLVVVMWMSLEGKFGLGKLMVQLHPDQGQRLLAGLQITDKKQRLYGTKTRWTYCSFSHHIAVELCWYLTGKDEGLSSQSMLWCHIEEVHTDINKAGISVRATILKEALDKL